MNELESPTKECRLVISGSRSITNMKVLLRALIECRFSRPTLLLNGVCKDGVDQLALEWARQEKVLVEEYPADWGNLTVTPCLVKYNRAGFAYNALAGHNRNREMAKRATHCLTIWDGKSPGTLNMMKLAKEYNLRRYEFRA